MTNPTDLSALREETDFWEHVDAHSRQNNRGIHYSILRLINGERGMEALRGMFPDGIADDLNFVLFSTSGVHGTYATIEEAESREFPDVTFVIVHPRLVCMRYGECRAKTEDDFEFLKKLRESSHKVASGIGMPTPPAEGR